MTGLSIVGPWLPEWVGLAGGGGGRIHAEEIREAQMNGNCNAMFSLLQGQRGRVGGVFKCHLGR